MKDQLDQTLGKHRQDMASQETIIFDLKKRLEESDQAHIQSPEAESRASTIEKELREESEASEQSHEEDQSSIEESGILRERLKFFQEQLGEVVSSPVLWLILDDICQKIG